MNKNGWTPYQEFIFLRSYARWLEDQQRRETWGEAIQRYHDFLEPRVPAILKDEFKNACRLFLEREIVGSMRALWTAGPALERNNLVGYNCSYLALQELRDFAEVMFLLMGGSGVGISVERQYIAELPPVPRYIKTDIGKEVVFGDSKEGWAAGFLFWLQELFNGRQLGWNLSYIRPKGARLKTFGGRASGPEPLLDLLRYTLGVVNNAAGRKLRSDEVSDILCKIAEVIVVGGVRRSALILLTNPSDRRMAQFKKGQFWETHPHRALANISTVYTEQPDPAQFMEDFRELIESGTGERGIVNRESLQRFVPSRRELQDFGVNPCGEVILRNKGLCNLTEVVCKRDDCFSDLTYKIRAATLLGCLQDTLVDFAFVSPTWARNCREEALLGVSLTGVMGSRLRHYTGSNHSSNLYLLKLKAAATDAARKYSEALGINMPAAVTCVKPSGTTSQLVGSTSGIHPAHSEYYVRRVRVADVDPLATFLRAKGVPHHPETGQRRETANTWVFEFPVQAPQGAFTRDQLSAIRMLNTWKTIKTSWCEHNPSATISVKPDEWMDVAAWVWREWDLLGGLTFLPADGGVYPLMPFEEITEEEYVVRHRTFPMINWRELRETEDDTEGARELSCFGGGCSV